MHYCNWLYFVGDVVEPIQISNTQSPVALAYDSLTKKVPFYYIFENFFLNFLIII